MKELVKQIMTGKDQGGAGVVLKPLLSCLSFIYFAAVFLVHALYRAGIMPSYRPKYPVISVGNITAGGVGKTPLVIFLAQILEARGRHPVILTRGYMLLSDEGAQASDEALMISEKLSVPVMINPDRVRAAMNAEACSMGNVFLLDDGFQHWPLKRDLDIVAIDATNAFGNGHLLPRGVLREPLSALRRADLFVLTRVDLGQVHIAGIRQKLSGINPVAGIVETVHAPVAAYDLWADVRSSELSCLEDRVAGICAIGAPDAFEVMLRREGAQVEKMFTFDDHHVYTAQDIERVMLFCRGNNILKVVTTHKDAVKLKAFQKAFQGVSLLVLEIEIKVVHGETELFSRIDRCVNS